MKAMEKHALNYEENLSASSLANMDNDGER